MNLTRESFYTLLFQLSGYICAAFAGMIIARTLGPSNKGIVTVVLLYPSLFFTIFNLTVGLGIIHHMGKKRYNLKAFVGGALIISIVVSGFALLIFFLTIGLLRETFYKGINGQYLLIVGLSIPFYLILYFFSSILQGSTDIKGYNIANQFPSFSNLLILLFFIVLWPLTVLEVIIAGISGYILGCIYSLFKVIKRARGISFNKQLTNRLFKDGGKIHIGAIATFIFNRANIFILNYYSTPSEVGFYSVAFSIANILLLFSVSLEIGLYPKIAYASMEEAIELVQVATRQILVITASAALLMALFSKGIVFIYGGKAFLPSVPQLLFLLPGIVVFVIPKILSTLWIRKGWFLQLTIISSCTAILSLFFNLLLIPKFEANGAAIATTMTYGLASLIGLVLFWKYVKKDVSGLFIPRREDIAIYQDIFNIFRR